MPSGWRGMLVVETIGRIRREHFVKGKPIKEIMRELKVSRNTVRKVLRSGATSFEYTRAVQPRPKLGAWHGDLDRMLSDNEARPSRDQLTLIRIHRQGPPVQPPFSADVQPLPGRSGRLHADVRLGEGAGREPGRAGARAFLYAAAAGGELRRAERVAARPL